MRIFPFALGAVFLASVPLAADENPRPFVAVDRLTGAQVATRNGTLLFKAKPNANASEIHLAIEKPFLPREMAGTYILGEVVEDEDTGWAVIVDSKGHLVGRPWENKLHYLSPSAHLALQDHSVVDYTPSKENGQWITGIRSCQLPQWQCVEDQFAGMGGGIYPLAFRDTLIYLPQEQVLARFKEGRFLWKTSVRLVSGGVADVDLDRGEVLAFDTVVATVHVFSLHDGRELFSWEAPKDVEEVAKALGSKNWEEGILSRCKAFSEGETPFTVKDTALQGYHPNWRTIGMALHIVEAAFLPSGDVLVLTGPGDASSSWLQCQGAPRAFVLDRKTGKIRKAANLLELVPPGSEREVGYGILRQGPNGPWFYCGDRGCFELRPEILTR